jgi:hypothetical protein
MKRYFIGPVLHSAVVTPHMVVAMVHGAWMPMTQLLLPAGYELGVVERFDGCRPIVQTAGKAEALRCDA